MEKRNADDGFMAFARLDGEATFQLTHMLFRRWWVGGRYEGKESVPLEFGFERRL
jgi:hypothetical protein